MSYSGLSFKLTVLLLDVLGAGISLAQLCALQVVGSNCAEPLQDLRQRAKLVSGTYHKRIVTVKARFPIVNAFGGHYKELKQTLFIMEFMSFQIIPNSSVTLPHPSCYSVPTVSMEHAVSTKYSVTAEYTSIELCATNLNISTSQTHLAF